MFNSQFNFYLSSIFIFISLIACASNQSDGQVTNPTENKNLLILTTENEPGQRLEIYGTVIDSITQTSIPNTKIYLYHADANGEYHPADPNDESTAKFSGEVISDENGNFIVQTIVPREYELNGNKHIHLHYILAEGYKQDGGVILFDHDVNDEIRDWATTTGFGYIIQLQEIDGIMKGDLVIQLVPN